MHRHNYLIDYSIRSGDRSRLAQSLNAGGLRKVAGERTYSDKIQKRRILLCIPAFLLIAIGLYKVFC